VSRLFSAGLPLLMVTVGCSDGPTQPRAQWKVYVATDAPVPQFGEQLLVEMIDQAGRVIDGEHRRLIDASQPELWPISFGVVPGPGTGMPRLRARLYRVDQTGSDGLPAGTALLDATAELTPPHAGVTPVALLLAMGCFGVAPDLSGRRTCDPASGQLAPEPSLSGDTPPAQLPRPGSWRPAIPVPCAGPAPSGMVCIAGGVFLMGSRNAFLGVGTDPATELLVQVRPFAIDASEVTVRQARRLVESMALSPPLTGDTSPTAAPPECTYPGLADGSHDDLPVNCVSWQQANAACRLLGKRLPTEAEWEYAATNLGNKASYPWGLDPDVCVQAVVARGRALFQEPSDCLDSARAIGVGPVAGSWPLDVTAQGVFDLAGNVDEWTADEFEAYTDSCWSRGAGLLVGPVCSSAAASGATHTVRGGSWQSLPIFAHGYARRTADGDGPAVSTGFRCALSL
jgi:formylglycine-generating enzyme required for sulfatase activity